MRADEANLEVVAGVAVHVLVPAASGDDHESVVRVDSLCAFIQCIRGMHH